MNKIPKRLTQAEIVKDLADSVCEKEFFATTKDTSELYRWAGEIWENSGENTIRQLVECADSDSSKFVKNEVIDKIKCKTFVDRELFNHDKNKIALKNCVMNLDTGEVQPFKLELYQTIQLPISYDENAECPLIDKFVKEVMGDMSEFFYEILAYCLISDYRFKKFFILLGEANTGKTTIVELMHKFLGDRNITGMTLQDLADNQFSKANLYNKLANICDDLPKVDMSDVGWIKQVTGNSPLYAEKKMIQSRVEFTNRAKLVFTCNNIPKTKGADTAFYSRLIIIPFSHAVQVPDNDLISKITTRSELSGLLNKVIIARKTLLSNNGFNSNPDIEKVAHMYNVGSLDSVASYQFERIVCDEETVNHTVKKDEVYQDYLGYCSFKKLATKEVNAFHRRLQEMIPNIYTMRMPISDDGERHTGYKGIRINYYAKIDASEVNDG